MKSFMRVSALAVTLGLSVFSAPIAAQGHAMPTGGMTSRQGMTPSHPMSASAMAQMQTMMQRSDQMMQRSQQLVQQAQAMPMSDAEARPMMQMAQHLSTMAVQAKGLATQMHSMMQDPTAVSDAAMHRDIQQMQKHLNGTMDRLDKMMDSMDRMQKRAVAPARP